MNTLMSDKKLFDKKSSESRKDSKKFGFKSMVKNHITLYKSITNT